jgi:hypothetical protein
MPLFRKLQKKQLEKSAPASTRLCSHEAAISGLTAEIRTLAARIDGLQRAFTALNAIRLALEAKTWTEFHRRRSGRVAGGCARAATAMRDAYGRYIPRANKDFKTEQSWQRKSQ